MHVEKAKYTKRVENDETYSEIRFLANSYFQKYNLRKTGSTSLYVRGIILFILSLTSYWILLNSSQFVIAQAGYLSFGLCLLILGMTLGHDAAHHCLTGKLRWDNKIFQTIFILQGLNPSWWKRKHNNSHHPYPNVSDLDSDLEITSLLRLSPFQKSRGIHKFQHLYAPFLYIFSSLIWIVIYDFKLLFKTKHGNLILRKNDSNVYTFAIIKIVYFAIYLAIPMHFSSLPAFEIATGFLIMHGILSLFVTFTFFISHHVTYTHYTHCGHQQNINTSWLEQQIASTVDFHPQSKLFNCIFGGFNTHVAHHLFPSVSHVHYPVLTQIIKSVLQEKETKYHAITFAGGICAHLKHLKNLGRAA
ncbi:fatty acid desaturase [Hymenobacter sp. BT175]|uniref:fatty acid desaturase family protein n=1 Tax=Hymenobacter translucens TaxID=2886507 RepID=UPI001D0EF41E|nr:fatty acid desaturase [Hymenobacter translucens]MCC2547645.1 fatty acid desaturase [Hymenobacter translucens]